MKFLSLILSTVLYTGLLHAESTDKTFQYARLIGCSSAMGFQVNGPNPFYVLSPPDSNDKETKFGAIHFFTPFGAIRIPFNFKEADSGHAKFVFKVPGQAGKKVAVLNWTPETEYEGLTVGFADYAEGVDARDFSSQKPSIQESSNVVLANAVGNRLIERTQEVAATFDFSLARSSFEDADFSDVQKDGQKRRDLHLKLKNRFALAVEEVLKQNTKALEEHRELMIKACNGDKKNQSLHNIALVKYIIAQELINEVEKMNAGIPQAVKDSLMSSIDENLLDKFSLPRYNHPEGILNSVEGYVVQTIGNERANWKQNKDSIAIESGDGSDSSVKVRRPSVKVPTDNHE